MPKTRQKKEQDIKSYIEKIGQSKGLVFANFDGLKVKDIEALRKQCRENGVDYVVVKKTLMKLAFQQANIAVDPKTFQNGVASVIGYQDEVAPAKIIGQFAKTHEALKPIGGILEQQFIDAAKVIELSKLPSKQELLAKVVGSI